MKLARILVPLGILALIALVAYNIAASSVEITSTGGGDGKYTYQIMNQADKKVEAAENKGSRYNQRLSAGTYEVTVSQGAKTFFTIFTINGRFGKTRVAAELQTENKRTFVGDNPASCVDLLNSTLLSHDCGTYSGDVKTHVPATPKQPTFVSTRLSPFGHIESTVQTKIGALAMFAKQAAESEEETPAAEHIVYTYDPAAATFRPIDQAVLPSLLRYKSYSLQPYKDGFLAYDNSFTHAFYYSSLHAKPVSIALDKPTTPDAYPFSLSAVSSGEIAVAYSPESDSDGEGPSPSVATEIIVQKASGSAHFTSKSQYSSVRFCGGNNLCMLNVSTNILEVNDISGAQLSPVLVLPEVTSVVSYDGGLLAARKDGLFKLDTSTKIGYYAYRYGDYEYCGLKTVIGGQVLCLTNPKGNKVALFIDETAKDTDSIDKKVAELQKHPDVVKLSIVGKIIYIVPKGKNIYAAGSVAPNPVIQGKINQGITDAAVKAGIDAPAYTIVITRPL